MGKAGGEELAKLDVLVAQLESMAASFKLQQQLDPLICFDLLADLISTIDEESPERILACQRKCEDALQNLLLLGVRPPARLLASAAVVELMSKGNVVSIYSRASGLQGWLTDTKKGEAASFIGAAHCLGALYKAYGSKITSNLGETSTIVGKLMRFQEVSVRQAGMQLLHDALEGCAGVGPWPAYAEGLRVTLKMGLNDKSPGVKALSAGCLKCFAITGGPGFVPGTLENCASLCLKAFEDPSQAVRDGFAAALGALVALGVNPQVAQVPPRPKANAQPPPAQKAIEGGLEKYLVTPFLKVSGPRWKEIRVGMTMAWVAFLQEMHLCYGKNDFELGVYAMQVLNMLQSTSNATIDPHAQACVLYVLRVGIVEQMGEPGQKELTDMLCKQLVAANNSPSTLVVLLRTLSHLLKTLGEVSLAARDALDSALVSTLSHHLVEVRVEAALTLRELAEVDATLASNVMSCGVTTLWALHEAVAVEKGDQLKIQLGILHGQAVMLAALLASFRKLSLGLPSRLPLAVLDVGRKLVLQPVRNPLSAAAEKEAGWMLISSYVSSLPREELEEREFDIAGLWTSYSGSVDAMLKQAARNLPAEISGWSAAVEALTAFVKSYVIPCLSPEREGLLLQPLLGYLSGAIACLSSTLLQQATPALKPSTDLFTIKLLRAFRTLPTPSMYRSEHTSLLRICTAPFREPLAYGESSCLRLLLDSRDSVLGPWVPGRDPFEDELRAFQGGPDGLLPCVWDEVATFPHPLPLATELVDEMMLCLGTIFGAVSDTVRLQLLDAMEVSNKTGKKQNWHDANLTNIFVALLGSLKKPGVQRLHDEVLTRIQAFFQEVLAEEACSTGHRRAAAEGLGLLARAGSDGYAARLMRTLLNEFAAGTPELLHKGSTAFALGCIHRSVGGMTLSALVPATVQILCSMARDPKEGQQIWVLHGLYLTTDSAGLAFVPHVQATLSVVMDVLLSEEHNYQEVRQSIGLLVNAVVAVLGPELSVGSSLYSRCKSVISVVSTGEEPAALLEGVLYTQQLVIFAPQALPVHVHVDNLIPTLFSKQPSLRYAAVATLQHLMERDPVAMVDQRIEEDLFAMLDTETDTRIVTIVCSMLQRLLDSTCPSHPWRWIQLCRTVVLASSKLDASSAKEFDEPFGEDDEGSMIGTHQNGEAPKAEIRRESDQLPRYRTRLFAAECLSRIPTAVGANPMHFDIHQARECAASDPAGDFLVLRLGEFIALAYQVATGEMESIRPIGVGLLDTILEKFGKTEDPDPEYAGHLLLEQYQAQFLSAVRTALDPSASPLLMASGARLAARIVTSGVAGSDRGVLQRVLNLISRPLAHWENLNYSAFAEWVGCKVKAGLLGAHAAVKTYALACLKSGQEKAAVGTVLVALLGNHVDLLNRCWIGLLKDYIMVCTQLPEQLQKNYKPFLEGMESPTIAAKLQEYLYEVCSLILEAVAVDAVPANSLECLNTSALKPVELSAADFLQLWTLSILILVNKGSRSSDRSRPTRHFPSFSGRIMGDSPAGNANLQLVALRAIRCLCSPSFCSPEMLSVDLCEELLSMLLNPSFHAYSWAPMAIICVVEQIVNSVPENYLDKETLVLTIADISIGYLSDLLSCGKNDWKAFEGDTIVCCALATLGKLATRSKSKAQAKLVPQLLSMGSKLLAIRGLTANVLSAVTSFVTCLTTVASDTGAVDQFTIGERCQVLSSAIETLTSMAENEIGIENMDQKAIEHLQLLLGILVAVARSVPEDYANPNLKPSAQKRSINCLRAALGTENSQIQLAVVHTLGAAIQAGISEQPRGNKNLFALMLMRELGPDISCIAGSASKGALSSADSNVVIESLKLLLLFHSLVVGDEAQREVLHVLLNSLVSATTVSKAFTSVAIKLVTQLASVPSTATQFKVVLSELPLDARTKLQEIIRTSVSQDSRSAPPTPGPIKVPLAMKPIAAVAKPSSSSSSSPPAKPSSPASAASSNDEWDDFQ